MPFTMSWLISKSSRSLHWFRKRNVQTLLGTCMYVQVIFGEFFGCFFDRSARRCGRDTKLEMYIPKRGDTLGGWYTKNGLSRVTLLVGVPEYFGRRNKSRAQHPRVIFYLSLQRTHGHYHQLDSVFAPLRCTSNVYPSLLHFDRKHRTIGANTGKCTRAGVVF